MQAAHRLQHIEAGTEIQMVGVAEDDLRLDLVADVADVASLDGAHRTDGHEDGR